MKSRTLAFLVVSMVVVMGCGKSSTKAANNNDDTLTDNPEGDPSTYVVTSYSMPGVWQDSRDADGGDSTYWAISEKRDLVTATKKCLNEKTAKHFYVEVSSAIVVTENEIDVKSTDLKIDTMDGKVCQTNILQGKLTYEYIEDGFKIKLHSSLPGDDVIMVKKMDRDHLLVN